MAIDKKKFLEMMMRPEALSAEDVDVVPENIDDALGQSVESPDEEYEMDEEIPAGVDKLDQLKQLDPKSVVRESEQSIGIPEDKYQADPEMAAMAGKVNAGSAQNSADLELKKKAIAATMKKYLGR
jgi:hypothetical protein